MIEVEKKFQPTEEQLEALLKDTEFLGEVANHDIYYDYPDNRMYLHKENICLRKRNGSFELKSKKENGSAEEIEDIKEIEKYFQTESFEDFLRENLLPFIEYKTKRLKYKKTFENFDFIIDVDETDFGGGHKYKMCEIELMVDSQEEVEDARARIFRLAKAYDFEIKKMFSKHKEYLRVVKPEVYKELFREK